MYYFFLHLLLQLAVHALNARVWNCLWFTVQIIVFLCRCPPTWVGQASMQLSRDPGHEPPDPPEPPRAYIVWFLVFIWSSSPMFRGLLEVVLLVVVLLVVVLLVVVLLGGATNISSELETLQDKLHITGSHLRTNYK